MPKTIIKTEVLAMIRRLCEAEVIHQETALLVQSLSEGSRDSSHALARKPRPRSPER